MRFKLACCFFSISYVVHVKIQSLFQGKNVGWVFNYFIAGVVAYHMPTIAARVDTYLDSNAGGCRG